MSNEFNEHNVELDNDGVDDSSDPSVSLPKYPPFNLSTKIFLF